MPPARNTQEPSFGDWVVETALLPTQASGGWPQGFQIVREHPTIVPNYQRGISWEVPQVNDLVYSTSPVIGTVVIGSFPNPPAPYLDPQVVGATTSEYGELADGLQRFSTGVVLLNAIFEKVLDPGVRTRTWRNRSPRSTTSTVAAAVRCGITITSCGTIPDELSRTSTSALQAPSLLGSRTNWSRPSKQLSRRP